MQDPSPTHVGSTSDASLFQLACEQCKAHGVTCGGVWRFHFQHGKYLMQCRPCRQRRRSCPFRKLENDGKPQTSSSGQHNLTKGKKRQPPSSAPSITSDSYTGSEESRAAGPSSHSRKGVKVKGKDMWDMLEMELIAERRKAAEIAAEIEVKAEIKLAKAMYDSAVKERQRKAKGRK